MSDILIKERDANFLKLSRHGDWYLDLNMPKGLSVFDPKDEKLCKALVWYAERGLIKITSHNPTGYWAIHVDGAAIIPE